MRMQLYHATHSAAGDAIKREGRFRPGTHGFAGAAIYFSQREAGACRKYCNGQGQPDVVIVCNVDLGNCRNAAKDEMNKDKCVSEGFDSVKIIKLDVFAIYDPSRIDILEFKDLRSQVFGFLQHIRQAAAENVETQEAQQHQDFERCYEEWGRGQKLGTSSGVVARGAVALRGARLAHLDGLVRLAAASAKEGPAADSSSGSCTRPGAPPEQAPKIQSSVEQDVLQVPPGQAALHDIERAMKDNESSKQSELRGALSPSPSTQAEAQGPMEDEDDELKLALLLSQMSLQDVLSTGLTPSDIEGPEVQQAILRSMQVDEEQQLKLAIAMSLQS